MMEYNPRYPQPFTLEQAVLLDVNTITEEIARLEHSLEHLQRTQAQLNEAAAEDPDPEFTKAIEENEAVIGSQEERVSMLKTALVQKGIPMSGHYATGGDYNAAPPTRQMNAPVDTSVGGLRVDDHSFVDDDNGIDL